MRVEDLGMVDVRAMDDAWSLPANESWQAVADAVIAAHEARRWKAWKTLPRDGSKFDAWHRGDLASKPHRLCNCFTRDGKVIDAEGYTRDEKWLTHWTPISAPPKEASDDPE